MGGVLRARVHVNTKILERAKVRLEKRGEAAKKNDHKISVGIHAVDGSQSKLDYDYKNTDEKVAAVAAAHEFGERSWLRTWFDQNRSRLIQEMVDVMRRADAGDHSAFNKQALEWESELREWIEYGDGDLKALQASTVATKKKAGMSSPETPLFATGQLVAAIKGMLDGSKP